jgi:hypothetical protein
MVWVTGEPFEYTNWSDGDDQVQQAEQVEDDGAPAAYGRRAGPHVR